MTQLNQIALQAPLIVGNKTTVEDVTRYLYEVPTINVSGTSQTKSVTLNLTGIQCINFQGGIGAATIESATLVVNATYIFINTAGYAANVVNLTLDNNGQIGGQSIFSLISGQPQKFQFDGTNLHS